MQALNRSLSQIRRKNGDNHYFTPSHLVRDVMESESVHEALLASNVPLYHVNEAVDVIRNGAWNVFAILVLMKEPQFILSFIKDDRLQRSSIDHKLPFEIDKLEELLEDHTMAQDFYDRQWGFTAPFFSGSVFTRILPSEFVLPFLSDEDLGEGSFGRVYKIQVERSYQQFGREPYHEVGLRYYKLGAPYINRMLKVVRKEFKPERKKSEYELELRNLSILRRLKHPNIIELLGSYTYRGKHNLIFPLARGGTLADLMRKARPPIFKHNEKIIIATSGLCSAVCAIHKQFSDNQTLLGIGCHHDLKPSNIFVDHDKFVVADFGLSRFKDVSEGSGTSFKYVGGCYVAPECEDLNELGHTNTKTIIGRSSDIWSLGCIMLEILVYMRMGREGVQRFEDERQLQIGPLTFHRFHHGPSKEEPVVATYLADLLEKSENRSERLLVELITEILQLNPDMRPKAEEIETRMWFIAIDAISQQIQDLYSQVWQMGNSPQAFIEHERFASWFQSCEILYSNKDSVSSDQWKSRSLSQYQSTLDSLVVIRDTLEAIMPEVEKPNRIVYRPLGDLNDSLLDSLPYQLQASARRRLEIQILGAEPQALPKEVLHSCHGPELQRIGMLATIKEMNSLVDQRSHTRRDDLWILPEHLSRQKRFGNHYIGKLNKGDQGRAVKVLYESKMYREELLDKSIREELHGRLEAIAELLQEATAGGFQVLHCSGYFHNPAELSCGLIYRLPTLGGLDEPDITTLRNILTEQRSQPVLGKRFSLAHNLAVSVLEFHKVGWLQKGISSLNIAFAFPSGSSWRNGVDKPYFLGFSSSRPNEPKAFSDYLDTNDRAIMDFQHPEYLKGEGKIRYRPEFDYYSLGMVLLEIGHWKSLSEITAKISGPPEDLRIELLKVQVPQLGKSMGVIYRDVVDACLRAEFGSPREVDKEFETYIDKFARIVVDPLAKCVV